MCFVPWIASVGFDVAAMPRRIRAGCGGHATLVQAMCNAFVHMWRNCNMRQCSIFWLFGSIVQHCAAGRQAAARFLSPNGSGMWKCSSAAQTRAVFMQHCSIGTCSCSSEMFNAVASNGGLTARDEGFGSVQRASDVLHYVIRTVCGLAVRSVCRGPRFARVSAWFEYFLFWVFFF